MVALLRALTLFDLLLSRPWRWLAGSSSQLQDWSVVSMGGVLDLVEQALARCANDGAELFKPDFDVFASVAATQPAFAEWRRESAAATIKSPDGTRHKLMALALAEAQTPTNRANKDATDMTVTLIEIMATAALQKMRDPRIAVSDWLSSQDGKYAIGKNAEMHAATVGGHTTTDRVLESNFGCYDYVLRRFVGIDPANASGIALQMRMHDLERPRQCTSIRRRSKKPQPEHTMGAFYALPEAMRMSLVEACRRWRARSRADARADRKAQLAYKQRKREENTQKHLNATVDLYAKSLKLFQSWKEKGFASITEADAVIRDSSLSDARKRKLLIDQIDMRVLSLGMSDLATPYSSATDANIGTTSHLRGVLKDVLIEEKTRRRNGEAPFGPNGEDPDEAQPPQLKVKTLKVLGTPTCDCEQLTSEARLGSEKLYEAAEAERKRRIEAGIDDDVEVRTHTLQHTTARARDHNATAWAHCSHAARLSVRRTSCHSVHRH